MTAEPPLLDSRAMARFVARGFLLLPGVVPQQANREFLEAVGPLRRGEGERAARAYARIIAESALPEIAPGTPLAAAYPPDSPLGRLIAVPEVAGAVASLLGPNPRFDHHFLHLALPRSWYGADEPGWGAQPLHQDSTIDVRTTFDVQLFYFPHPVERANGGTRFLPGSHLRRVSEMAIARYHNVVGQMHASGPAGTVLIAHHGLWHGGGTNRSEAPRVMFKTRLNPSVPQVRLWDDSDLEADHDRERPIFFVKARPPADDVRSILATTEPWYEHDTGRLEIMNRARLWRHVSGDPDFDVDYWLTRVENEPGA